MIESDKRFLVALSFPGEKRGLVASVAHLLGDRLTRKRVLYDAFYEAEFARPDLDTYLQRLYRDDSQLVVVFLCSDYARKEWPGLEWRAIRGLIKQRQGSSVMFIRLDDAAVEGFFSIDGYVLGEGRSASELADLIMTRLGSVQAESLHPSKADTAGSMQSNPAGFSSASIKDCAEIIVNLAYYNKTVSLEKIALWWIFAYDLWCRSKAAGPFTNADLLVSHLPSRDAKDGGIELDRNRVRLALAECARIGYLREEPGRYSGVNYEITIAGRELFARAMITESDTNGEPLEHS